MSARGAAFVVTALAIARPAAAAGDAVAEARALFDRGLEDMQAGRFDAGCPALATSQRLDPHPGTLFTLAECEARRGHLATARARYGEYLGVCASLSADKRARQSEREAIARRQRDELAPLLGRVVVRVDAAVPPGSTARLDGEPLGADALDSERDVDPGDHAFALSAPGGAERLVHLKILAGERRSVTLGLERDASAPISPDGADSRRVAGIAVGAVGLVGLAVGAVSGGLMLGKRSAIDAGCRAVGGSTTSLCTPDGAAAGESAKTLGAVASVGLGVGVAALGIGVVLFATAPRPASALGAPRPTFVVGLGANGQLTASGAF